MLIETPAPDSPPPPPAVSSRAAIDTIERYLADARARLLARGRLVRAASAVRLLVGVGLCLAVLRTISPAFDLRTAALLSFASWVLGLWFSSSFAHERLDENMVAEALHHDDRRAGRLPFADELHSLIELRGKLPTDNPFVILLAQRIASNLAATPVALGLPLTTAHRALRRTLLTSALGLGVVSLVAPRLLPEAWAAIRHGAPRDIAHPPAPIVGDLELSLTPPSYTGLPPRTLPSSGGELRVLRGTQVHIKARSLGRTLRAELLVELDGRKPQRLPVTLESQTAALPTVESGFTVAAPGHYSFVLWRWTGRIVEPEPHVIAIDPDLAPRVELRVPADPLELSVPRPIELGIDAEDDFGLGTVSLVYRVGDAEPQRKVLTLTQPTPRRAQGRFTWELGELEKDMSLPPGVKISYWIEAEDNDEVSGKKVGRSRTATITLRTADKPATVDRTNLEALGEATLAHLADRLDRVATIPNPHAQLLTLIGTFQKISRATMGATPALTKLTTEIATRLDRLAGEEATRDMNDKVIAELERDVLALDDLRGKRRLDDMVRIGNEMKRARDELKRLMEELKSASTDAQKELLKKEIERKLVELEAKMAELRRAAADSEGEVPDEFLNRDAIAKQAAQDQPDDIRKMLAKGDLDKAMSELERMSKSLDQLTGQLEKGQKSQHDQSDPAQAKALGELENELADLSKEERDVQSESDAIKQKAAARATGKSGSLKDLREKLKPKLAEFDRRAEEQSHEGRWSDREELQRMRNDGRNVDRALEAEDLDEAQGMALDARRLAAGMSVGLHEEVQQQEAEAQARVGDGPSASLRRSDRRAAELEQLARQIEAELAKVDGARQPTLSSDEKKRLEELSKRQQGAQQKGQSLRQRMGQDPSLQGLPQTIGRDVDGAQQSIGESQHHLQRSVPGRGAESAGDAAKQLESARKQVADARRGNENGREDNGQNQRDEPVRIPGADDSAAPKAFREELLDAMKRGAPKRFEEQVQRYYEELVR